MARFALNPDYRDFLSECNAQHVEYLVIGGQAVTFGNLADSGTALRAARKARRQELAQEAASFQSPLFEL